jgi:fatty acid desaturase
MNVPALPLRYREDRRTLALLACLSGLFVVQYGGVARHPVLLGLTYVLVLVPLIAKHNHNHCHTFHDRRWNDAFSLWLTLLTGMTTTGVITAHNRLHHGANQTDDDFVRCSLVRFRWNWLNFVAFFFASAVDMWRQRPADLAEWRRTRPHLYRLAIVERSTVIVFIAALLVADWRSTLVVFAGPRLFGQWFLVTINLVQHQDCDPDSAVNHSRNVTGRVINWLLLNNGYHTAHHDHPGLHWSRLADVHRSLLPSIDPALNERSLLRCVARRFIAGAGWVGAPAVRRSARWRVNGIRA